MDCVDGERRLSLHRARSISGSALEVTSLLIRDTAVVDADCKKAVSRENQRRRASPRRAPPRCALRRRAPRTDANASEISAADAPPSPCPAALHEHPASAPPSPPSSPAPPAPMPELLDPDPELLDPDPPPAPDPPAPDPAPTTHGFRLSPPSEAQGIHPASLRYVLTSEPPLSIAKTSARPSARIHPNGSEAVS